MDEIWPRVIASESCVQFQNITKHSEIWGAIQGVVFNREQTVRKLPQFSPVFRIRDILVRIRIRILESVPLTNGTGSGSCSFRQWPSRRQKKIFFKKVLCLFLFGTFTSFFKDKKSQRSHKTVEMKCFLIFYACWWRIRIRPKIFPIASFSVKSSATA